MSASDPVVTVCPKCGYKRKAEEFAPDWQCPSCHVAYSKVIAPDLKLPGRHEARPVLGGSRAYRASQRLLSVVLIAAVATAVLSWYQKRQIPPLDNVVSSLQREPVQKNTGRGPFSFEYLGATYEVKPIASYDLHGLIVTHNDINAFFDIYHDDSSVDTRDICVVWGENLVGDDIRRSKFWSTAWTCWFEYPAGVSINGDQLSNNHLITNDASVRDRISSLRVGDQVRVQGMLVNYRPADEQYWRESSLVRGDEGAGACEVVFVEQLDLLQAGNAGWYSLYTASRWAISASIIAKLLLLFANVSAPMKARRAFRASPDTGGFDSE